MSKNLYVDYHILQTVPPSCINRDDTGSPKTAVFGGKNRARVSSQAWKHAMRENFKNIFSEDEIGYRTKNVKTMLVNEICALDSNISEENAIKLSGTVLEAAGVKSGGDKKDVLFFISKRQLKNLAKAALELKDDKTKKEKEKNEIYKQAVRENPSIDIALFGRMAANDPSLNYDAAAQVAHAISTHAISNEYDYFTAVDDYMAEDASGAGHLGTVEFNSSTLYRYATINIGVLLDYLDAEEVKMAIKGFTEAFIFSMPTGKQNTFANRTVPDMVYVTIREDQPVNLANAFEKPIPSGENGFAEKSQKAFAEYADKVYKNWVAEPKKAWVVGEAEIKNAVQCSYFNMKNEIINVLEEETSNSERM